MPTKTKAQLEIELKQYQTRAEKAEIDLQTFKKRIPEVMQEKIEAYDLDLCAEGVAEFCNELGIDTPKRLYDACANIYVSGLKIEGQSDSYGGTDLQFYEVEEALNRAIRSALDKFETNYVSISMDFEIE